MKRETFDQWRVRNSEFNKNATFYVQCDCGELAKKVSGKSYYVCSHCGRNYVEGIGNHIELRDKKS